MPEKTSCITDRTIEYEGIFSVAELCQLVDGFFDKRGYGRTVASNAETVKPKGKFILLKLVYKKIINDYARYEVEVAYQFENITMVEIVREGHKKKMNKGKAMITIDSWVITDYEKSWEIHPTFYFLRTIGQKFFFKNLHSKWENDVKRDVKELCNEIGSYFNIQKIEQ